jgi:tetratricopeptide (TPR) repeat protein
VTDRLSQERLDELWDFADAAGSEQRFRAAIAASSDPTEAAGLGTQLARALGLQERYAEGDEVLDAIPDVNAVVTARRLLERGRLRNSSGHPGLAIPLFEEALAAAAAVDHEFLEIDAAHMLAIADPSRAPHWIARALETVDETKDARTRRWAVSLNNNAGWGEFEAGRYTEALAEFELAADAARDYGTAQQQVWAQEAIDEVLAKIEIDS